MLILSMTAGPCAATRDISDARKQQKAHAGTGGEAFGVRVQQSVMDNQSKQSLLPVTEPLLFWCYFQVMMGHPAVLVRIGQKSDLCKVP